MDQVTLYLQSHSHVRRDHKMCYKQKLYSLRPHEEIIVLLDGHKEMQVAQTPQHRQPTHITATTFNACTTNVDKNTKTLKSSFNPELISCFLKLLYTCNLHAQWVRASAAASPSDVSICWNTMTTISTSFSLPLLPTHPKRVKSGDCNLPSFSSFLQLHVD